MRTKSLISTLAHPRILGWIVFIFLFAAWGGIPAFNKWRADKKVDELCAKEGGIEIYGTVKLPAEKFTEFGEIYVPQKKQAKSSDEYFYTTETTWIIPEGTQVRDLTLWRDHYKLFRAIDGKLLAESIVYARRGGDAAGPWHPSHYACPAQAGGKRVNQRVFIRESGDGK